jgi:hypothetical protein
MTLSARPKTVEPGEWIAHQGEIQILSKSSLQLLIVQVVEHYRNLWNFVKVIHEKEDDGTTICNSRTCPRMSAGA